MESQQITDIMAKLNKIIEGIQKLQVRQATLTICIDLRNTHQLNRRNCNNEGRPSRNHNMGRYNNEYIENTKDKHCHDILTWKVKVDVPTFYGTYGCVFMIS